MINVSVLLTGNGQTVTYEIPGYWRSTPGISTPTNYPFRVIQAKRGIESYFIVCLGNEDRRTAERMVGRNHLSNVQAQSSGEALWILRRPSSSYGIRTGTLIQHATRWNSYSSVPGDWKLGVSGVTGTQRQTSWQTWSSIHHDRLIYDYTLPSQQTRRVNPYIRFAIGTSTRTISVMVDIDIKNNNSYDPVTIGLYMPIKAYDHIDNVERGTTAPTVGSFTLQPSQTLRITSEVGSEIMFKDRWSHHFSTLRIYLAVFSVSGTNANVSFRTRSNATIQMTTDQSRE